MAGSTYEVTVEPVATGWSAKLEAQIGPQVRAFADQIRQRLQDAVRDGLSGTGIGPRTQGTRTGTDFADAFSRSVKSRIEATLRALPTVQVGVATTAAEQHLRDLSVRIKALGENIELGVNDKAALVEVDLLRRQLRELTRGSTDVRVRVNAGTALAEIEALKRTLNDTNSRGNFITRALDDIRTRSSFLDGLIGKLGDVGGVLGKIGVPYLLVSALSLIGPLAGAGTAALFGLAGAAGVAGLAFVGLREQMANGVGQGAQLRTEFDGISTEIAQLGRLAANAVGPGLTSALERVKNALPGFAPLVDLVGAKLGSAAGHAADALVTMFQRAQPLIADFAGYIDDAASALSKFAGSKEFGQFLDYARQVLPEVGQAVVDLGKGIVSLGQAMSTLGENTLATLDGLGKVAEAIGKVGSAKPLGNFGGGLADKLGLTSVGGVLADFTNPIGFTLKTLNMAADQTDKIATAEANIRAKWKAAQQDYANSSDGLAARLGVTNGAYKAATDAAAQNAAQLRATTLQMQLQNDAAGLLKAALDGLSGKDLGVAQSLTSFQQGLLGLKTTFAGAAFSATDLTTAAVTQRGALQSLVLAAQAHAEAVGTQTNSTAAATATLRADYAQILANTGATGGQVDAIRAYIQSIGAIPAVKSTQLDINTAAAVATVQGFRSLINSIPATKGIELSVSTSGAEAAIQRLVSTPRTAYVQVQTVGIAGTSGGRAELNAYGGLYTSVGHYAAGGIIDGLSSKLRANAARFAQGTESHVPQIAMPNGGVRIWAEPETQGEAYIPFAQDRRARAEDIVSQVSQRFGGAFIPARALSALAAASAPSSAPVGTGLVGVAVTIDAGSVGTLTGHITDVADGRIASTASQQRLAGSAGPSSRLT